MRLELTGRHVEITPALRRIVDSKLAKLERLLNDSAVSAQAVLTREKYRHRAEITLHARGEKFLHGVGSTQAWGTSVGEAIEKITQQAHRLKGKWQERKRRGGRRETAPLEPTAPARAAAAEGVRPRMPRILRMSRQAVKLMLVSEAVRAAEASVDGLIVFRESQNASIAVVYRRPNGELALVEVDL